MSSLNPNMRGALTALLAFAIFATHDVLVKDLGSRYAAPQVVFFSVLLSFPLLTLMLIRQKAAATLRPRHLGWVVLRSLVIVITGLSVFYAFSVLPLAQTYAMLFTTPLLITILSVPLLGERVGWYRGGAVIVGLIGVVIVLRPGASELSFGHAAAILGACGASLASVIVRKIGQSERSAVLLLYPMLGNIVIMGALLPQVYVPMPLPDLALSAAVAALGFTAMSFMIMAYRLGEAAVVAPMQYSQLVWAILFGALIFDETVDAITLIGSGVIVASGLFIVWRERKGSGSENQPVLNTRARPDTGTAPRLPREEVDWIKLAGQTDDPLARP